MAQGRRSVESSPSSLPLRQLEEALRWAVWDAAFATAMNTLVMGVFLTGFALALGADARFIGLMAAIPPLGNLLQVPASWVVQHVGQRRALSLWAFGVARSLRVLMVALPWLFPPAWRLTALLLVLSGVALTASLGMVAWASWMRDLVPLERRGRFFAYRNRVAGVVSLVTNLLGASFLDLWRRAFDEENLMGFSLLFALAVLTGWASLWCLARMPELPMPQPEAPLRWSEMLLRPLRDRAFRRFALVISGWTVALNLAAPFFSVYMLRELGLPYSVVNGFVILSQVMGLLHISLWGRLVDTFGNQPVLLFCRFIIAMNPLWWLGTNRRNYLWHIFWPHFLGGMTGGGAELATWNLLLILSPADASPLYLSSFSAITSLASTLGPALGGWVAARVRDVAWQGPFWHLEGLEIVFLLSAFLRFLSLPGFGTLPDVRQQSVWSLLRYLQRARTLSPLRLIAWLGVGLGRLLRLTG